MTLKIGEVPERYFIIYPRQDTVSLTAMTDEISNTKAKRILYAFLAIIIGGLALIFIGVIVVSAGMGKNSTSLGKDYAHVDDFTEYGRIIHKDSDTETEIISPYVITYTIEKDQLYGARIPFSPNMPCVAGAPQDTGFGYEIRIEYFILDLSPPNEEALSPAVPQPSTAGLVLSRT